MNHLEAMDLNEYLRRERLGMSYRCPCGKEWKTSADMEAHLRFDVCTCKNCGRNGRHMCPSK